MSALVLICLWKRAGHQRPPKRRSLKIITGRGTGLYWGQHLLRFPYTLQIGLFLFLNQPVPSRLPNLSRALLYSKMSHRIRTNCSVSCTRHSPFVCPLWLITVFGLLPDDQVNESERAKQTARTMVNANILDILTDIMTSNPTPQLFVCHFYLSSFP